MTERINFFSHGHLCAPLVVSEILGGLALQAPIPPVTPWLLQQLDVGLNKQRKSRAPCRCWNFVPRLPIWYAMLLKICKKEISLPWSHGRTWWQQPHDSARSYDIKLLGAVLCTKLAHATNTVGPRKIEEAIWTWGLTKMDPPGWPKTKPGTIWTAKLDTFSVYRQ